MISSADKNTKNLLFSDRKTIFYQSKNKSQYLVNQLLKPNQQEIKNPLASLLNRKQTRGYISLSEQTGYFTSHVSLVANNSANV